MKSISKLLERDKNIRVIGFDDSPFLKTDRKVNISGIVYNNNSFEGILWGEITKDGTDSTEIIIKMVKNSKFYDQINCIFFDGIAFGGFNIFDLPKLAEELKRPCVSVMRREPNLDNIKKALKNFNDFEIRWNLIKKAGEIYKRENFIFQVYGESPDIIFKLLKKITINGDVPEPLRLAHLIGSGVKKGESGNRA